MDKTLVIRAKMDHDDDFLRLCLLRLYTRQEEDEQAARDTNHENGVGFNRADASLLSMAAEDWKHLGAKLKPVVLQQVRERMKKYARQLTMLISQAEIDK